MKQIAPETKLKEIRTVSLSVGLSNALIVIN